MEGVVQGMARKSKKKSRLIGKIKLTVQEYHVVIALDQAFRALEHLGKAGGEALDLLKKRIEISR